MRTSPRAPFATIPMSQPSGWGRVVVKETSILRGGVRPPRGPGGASRTSKPHPVGFWPAGQRIHSSPAPLQTARFAEPHEIVTPGLDRMQVTNPWKRALLSTRKTHARSPSTQEPIAPPVEANDLSIPPAATAHRRGQATVAFAPLTVT